LHYRQRTEPQSDIALRRNLVKFGRVVSEICERTDKQTNKQTDRHDDRNTIERATDANRPPCRCQNYKMINFIRHRSSTAKYNAMRYLKK